MNTKLTIRLIGYSLIVVWAVWLIGRTNDVEPGNSMTTEVLSEIESGTDSDVARSESIRTGNGKQVDRITSAKVKADPTDDDSLNDFIAADPSEDPPPLVEAYQAKAVRLYIDRMVSTDQRIDRLMDYARQSPDDPAWSTPIIMSIDEVIRVAERERFEAGELYVECGGLLCFIHGDLNMDTMLIKLPLAVRAALNRRESGFAVAKSQKSEKYGWVFFVASPDFDIPPED